MGWESHLPDQESLEEVKASCSFLSYVGPHARDTHEGCFCVPFVACENPERQALPAMCRRRRDASPHSPSTSKAEGGRARAGLLFPLEGS